MSAMFPSWESQYIYFTRDRPIVGVHDPEKYTETTEADATPENITNGVNGGDIWIIRSPFMPVREKVLSPDEYSPIPLGLFAIMIPREMRMVFRSLQGA